MADRQGDADRDGTPEDAPTAAEQEVRRDRATGGEAEDEEDVAKGYPHDDRLKTQTAHHPPDRNPTGEGA